MITCNDNYRFIIKGKSRIFLDGYEYNSRISFQSALKMALSKEYQHFASIELGEDIEHFLFQIKNYGIFIKVK